MRQTKFLVPTSNVLLNKKCPYFIIAHVSAEGQP